jgi:type IV secretory pathway VirB10-like protein
MAFWSKKSASATMDPALSAVIAGSAAAEPKRAVPKKMGFTILIGLLVVLVGAKAIDDLRKGNFTNPGPKQANREVGAAGDEAKVKVAMRAGVTEAKEDTSLTSEQIEAAVKANPSMSTADAIKFARATNPNPSLAGSPLSVRGAIPVADKTQVRIVDSNAPTPDSLGTSSGRVPAPGGINLNARNVAAGVSSTAQAADGLEKEERMRREQELFSRRTSPILAAGSSGGSSPSDDRASADPSRTDRSGNSAGAEAPTDPVATYLKALASSAGGGAQKPAGGGQSDWLAQQRAAKNEDAVISAPTIQGDVLLPGNVIRLVTRTSIRSDLEGDVLAQVTEDVYDSVRSTKIIIPKGSQVRGTASSELRPGQERALTAFRTLYLPDGRSFELRGMTGSDSSGAPGFDADVDRRLFRRYGAGLLLGAIAYAIDRKNPTTQVTPVGGTATQQKQTLGDYAGNALTETTRSLIEAQRGVPELLTVPAGYQFTIIVRSPLVLVPAYSK